ncbi:MAG: hypothetical protein GY924_04565, partial [Planctomycetaceae bacterium]|nr:hypothetical protein [Planctomycetaceae bacterium]
MSLGDVVIEFWMGPGYADWAVIATLAVGSMLPLSQSAAINTLIGMDEHGKIAKWSIVVSTVSVAVGFVIISFTGWSLVGAALLNVGPMFVGIGAVALVVGCRVLDISAPEYFKRVLRDPIILMVSSGAILYLVRLVGPQSTGMMIALGLISQSMVALVILRN